MVVFQNALVEMKDLQSLREIGDHEHVSLLPTEVISFMENLRGFQLSCSGVLKNKEKPFKFSDADDLTWSEVLSLILKTEEFEISCSVHTETTTKRSP